MTFGLVDSGLRVSSELASGTTFNYCRFLTTSPVEDSTTYDRGLSPVETTMPRIGINSERSFHPEDRPARVPCVGGQTVFSASA